MQPVKNISLPCISTSVRFSPWFKQVNYKNGVIGFWGETSAPSQSVDQLEMSVMLAQPKLDPMPAFLANAFPPLAAVSLKNTLTSSSSPNS